mgnify:CR=1 FL=1
MFDITTAEVLVVVTGAGLLLGRREITRGARVVGWSVGKLVGSLQGIRMKYEEKTHGTQLYKLHKHVKDGLADMGTIGTDLNALSGRGGSMTNIVSRQQKHHQQVLQTEAAAVDKPQHQAPVLGAYTNTTNAPQTSNIKPKRGILGSNSISTEQPPVARSSPPIYDSNSIKSTNQKLAQLILAENILLKERGPASTGDPAGRMLGGLHVDEQYTSTELDPTIMTGSDLVEMSLCESIVQESYISSQNMR